MRRVLEAFALVALAVQGFLTWRAFVGPERLPARVPMHFDVAGNPDGWGSPASLLFFPGIAVFIYLLFSVVTRFPSAFNYPVRVTPLNRARLEGLALNMIAWLKVELISLFTAIQWSIVEAARSHTSMAPAGFMPLALIAVFATVGWHIAAMFRKGRGAF
jgi:Protein of unknown function (DUF1648)